VEDERERHALQAAKDGKRSCHEHDPTGFKCHGVGGDYAEAVEQPQDREG
jgi:hypothetical protein